jgi:hypothetical protein
VAKLYKGSVASDVGGSKTSGGSDEFAVPYQPVIGGAKVLGSKEGRKERKGRKFKLKIKTPK